MNQYDQQSDSKKWLSLLGGGAPPIIAGWIESSWSIGFTALGGGFIAYFIWIGIVSRICKARTSASSDPNDFHECFIGPFLLGPVVCNGIIAWYLVEYGMPW